MDSSFKNTQLVKLVLSIEKLTKQIEKLNENLNNLKYLSNLNHLSKLNYLEKLNKLDDIDSRLDYLNTRILRDNENNWTVGDILKSIYNKM